MPKYKKSYRLDADSLAILDALTEALECNQTQALELALAFYSYELAQKPKYYVQLRATQKSACHTAQKMQKRGHGGVESA